MMESYFLHICFTSIFTSLLLSRWCASFTTIISEWRKGGGVATEWMLRLCSKMGFSAEGKKSVMVTICDKPVEVKDAMSIGDDQLVSVPWNWMDCVLVSRKMVFVLSFNSSPSFNSPPPSFN